MFRRLSVALAFGMSVGCATYTGTGTNVEIDAATLDPGWSLIEGVPVQRQQHEWDCGLAAWSMVMRYWSIDPDSRIVAKTIAPIAAAERPIRAAELRDLAQDHGLLGFVLAGQVSDLDEQVLKGRPLIVGLVKPTLGGSNAHYEVVVGVHPTKRLVMTYDPGLGYRQNTYEGFEKEWRASGSVTILLLPAPPALAASTRS
jgi:ABC-type bacteriocin/lantibiotic exporter with double-glycine peptidase domain